MKPELQWTLVQFEFNELWFVCVTHFLIGSSKFVLLHIFFVLFCTSTSCIKFLSGESDDYDEERSDVLESELGSAGTYGTSLGGFSHGLWFPLGVTIYDYESCNGDRRSLELSKVNIGDACTREYTYDANIFSCCTNIGWIMDWSDVCQIFWNGFIWFSVIRISVNWVGIFLIPIKNWIGVIRIYRILCLTFQLHNYFCAQNFWKCCCL